MTDGGVATNHYSVFAERPAISAPGWKGVVTLSPLCHWPLPSLLPSSDSGHLVSCSDTGDHPSHDYKASHVVHKGHIVMVIVWQAMMMDLRPQQAWAIDHLKLGPFLPDPPSPVVDIKPQRPRITPGINAITKNLQGSRAGKRYATGSWLSHRSSPLRRQGVSFDLRLVAKITPASSRDPLSDSESTRLAKGLALASNRIIHLQWPRITAPMQPMSAV